MNEQPTQNDQDEAWEPLVTPRTRWWRSWSFWLLVGGAAVISFGFLVPILRHSGRGEIVNVHSNAKQVVRALAAFKEEYGSYPNEDTIAAVLKRHPEAKGLLGKTSSNDFFRQLIVAGYVDGERPFPLKYRHSDDLAKDQASGRMLEAGECAFSYVVWETDEEIPKRAPLLLVPLIPGQLAFDFKLAIKKLGPEKAIIGYSDGSLECIHINPAGKGPMGGGKFFFDVSLPQWGGKLPRIVWPE
jgi:hypothetical protein